MKINHKYEFDDDVASICESTVGSATPWRVLGVHSNGFNRKLAGRPNRGMSFTRQDAQNGRLATSGDCEHQGVGWAPAVLRALCGL